MKKYFLGLLFLASSTFTTTNVLATTCLDLGIAAGSSCNKDTLPAANSVYVGCPNNGFCVFMDCTVNGTQACTCAGSAGCAPLSDRNLRCKTAPTWYNSDTTTGVMTGSCEAYEAGVGNITVYTCMDGFYTITENDKWGGYTFYPPTCVHCPYHSDDINYGQNKPSYVTTYGAGIHYGMDSCNIKASYSITDETGTFEFTSDCPY